MTTPLERPLQTRAGLRAMIYTLSTRARRTPPYHPLRLQLEEELAELQLQLAEVEQSIGASLEPRQSKLAAPREPLPVREPAPEVKPAVKAAPAPQHHAEYARAQAADRRPVSRDTSEDVQVRPAPSIAPPMPRRPPALVRWVRHAGATVAGVSAAGFGAMSRMLRAAGMAIAGFVVAVLGIPGRCARYVRTLLERCALVIGRNFLRFVGLLQQGIGGGSRLVRRGIEIAAAGGEAFIAFAGRVLSRSGARLKSVLGSCVAAAGSLCRKAGVGLQRGGAAIVSALHRSSQAGLGACRESWRWLRPRLVDARARTGAGLRRGGVAIGVAAGRSYAAAMAGAVTGRRLWQQHVEQPASRWAQTFRHTVAPRLAENARRAAGASRRAAERAGAQAKRGLVAGGRLLQTFRHTVAPRLVANAREAAGAGRRAAERAGAQAKRGLVAGGRLLQTFRHAVAPRLVANAREAAGAGRRAAERAGAAAKSGLVAGGRHLQTFLAEAPDNGRRAVELLSRVSRQASNRLEKISARLAPLASRIRRRGAQGLSAMSRRVSPLLDAQRWTSRLR